LPDNNYFRIELMTKSSDSYLVRSEDKQEKYYETMMKRCSLYSLCIKQRDFD